MELLFWGTRGYINSMNKSHRRHTATLIKHNGKRVMITCGVDWQNNEKSGKCYKSPCAKTGRSDENSA
jgi:hypothetical protein